MTDRPTGFEFDRKPSEVYSTALVVEVAVAVAALLEHIYNTQQTFIYMVCVCMYVCM